MSIPEKRLRIRSREDVSSGNSKINSQTAQMLGIQDEIEAVVAGKSRGKWKVLQAEAVPANEVWINGDEMKGKGLADNTIATIRKSR